MLPNIKLQLNLQIWRTTKALSFPYCPWFPSTSLKLLEARVCRKTKDSFQTGVLGNILIPHMYQSVGTANCTASHFICHISLRLWTDVFSISLHLLQRRGEDDKSDVLKQIFHIPSGLCNSSCLKSHFLAQPEHCDKWGESLSNCGWCRRGLWRESLLLGNEGCFRQNKKKKCCRLTDLFPLSLFYSS